MKATLEQGKRYRVRVRVPRFIDHSTAVKLLGNQVVDLVVSEPKHGRELTVDATWRAPTRTIDESFLIDCQELKS